MDKNDFKKCFITKLFMLFLFSGAIAQVKEGVLRIKLKEEKADLIKEAQFRKSARGFAMVGDVKLDAAMEQCRAYQMSRVFRPAGVFEEKHRKYGLHLWYEITFDNSISIENALNRFRNIEDVLITEPVHEKFSIDSDPIQIETSSLTTPTNDTFYDYQWHYENTGSNSGLGGGGTADADIDLPEAWTIQTGDPSVVVAIIDGGIDVAHQDISANMWVNTGEIAGNGIDDDGNGYSDDIYGYNFGDQTGAVNASNHGTHVGGTVAAVTNNSTGVAGIAGGNGLGDGVRLMSLATFGDNANDGFDEAFIYAADMGAVIAQNSWGYVSPGVYDQSVLDAIDYFIAEAGYDANSNPVGPMQGGIVIFAAGNDGTDDQWYPAYYSPVIAVGGTDLDDNEYTFSNRGSWVELAAPAVDVVSTYPGNGYGYATGTSMACPHVSGVAALIVSEYAGSITPAEVWSRLVGTTDPLSVSYLGSGRLNAFEALQPIVTQPIFPDPTKTYYIDNPRWNVRLGANGSQDAFTTSTSTTGSNVEWTITPSPTADYYYIDCVGGGSAPRIRSDQSQFADMQATSSGGSWTRWAFTEVSEDLYYLTTLNNSNYDRLRVNNSLQVETVASNFTGSWTRFTFTEAGVNSNSSARDSDPDAAFSFSNNENNSESVINVYPIPATDYLNISIADERSFVRAEIIDVSGRLQFAQSISGQPSLSIDVQDLSEGMHFLRMVDTDGRIEVIRFIK